MSKEKVPPMAMAIKVKDKKKGRPKKQWIKIVKEYMRRLSMKAGKEKTRVMVKLQAMNNHCQQGKHHILFQGKNGL